jgi:SAM-dependent methyltransferase
MPDVSWNKSTWDGSYDWSRAGDEWSGPWGNSESMWFASLMPRVGFLFPCASVLEIAPGHGRCTQFLLRFTQRYKGIDLSQQCVDHCRARFAGRQDADFVVNDGLSLAGAADQTYNLIFSFDSLVHADNDAIAAYVPQILGLLAPGGIAFIHHSNLAAFPGIDWQFRSKEVSGESMRALVEGAGGVVLVQELFGGDGTVVPDCFTTFGRRADFATATTASILSKDLFSAEGTFARKRFAPYIAVRDSLTATSPDPTTKTIQLF